MGKLTPTCGITSTITVKVDWRLCVEEKWRAGTSADVGYLEAGGDEVQLLKAMEAVRRLAKSPDSKQWNQNEGGRIIALR